MGLRQNPLAPLWSRSPFRNVVNVEPGWYELIADLDRQLADLDPGSVILSLRRSAHGGLAVRYCCNEAGADNPVAARQLVRDAEARSYGVCERCGAPGTPVRRDDRRQVLCGPCAAGRPSPFPLVLLGINGVVALPGVPRGALAPPPSSACAPSYGDFATVPVAMSPTGRPAPFEIRPARFSRTMGADLLALPAEIRWLSSWAVRGALGAVTGALRLPWFPIAGVRRDDHNRSLIPKAAIVRSVAAMGRRTVWIDPDARAVAGLIGFERPASQLWVEPNPAVGLTSTDLAQVRQWIEATEA